MITTLNGSHFPQHSLNTLTALLVAKNYYVTLNSPVFISDLLLHHPELGRWNICTTCASEDWIHFFFLLLWRGLIMSKWALACRPFWTPTVRWWVSSLLPSIIFSVFPSLIVSVSPPFHPSKGKINTQVFVKSLYILFFKYFITD